MRKMANFRKAIFWLKNGKKVRRPMWPDDSYWRLGIDETICWKEGNKAHIHLNQIDAEDWEIFKEEKLKPVMRVFCKRDWVPLAHKYKFTTSMIFNKIEKAKDSDVLCLQTQFREGFHWIDNIWILNEESPEVFMELMFGAKK